jgi:hypothetical protein
MCSPDTNTSSILPQHTIKVNTCEKYLCHTEFSVHTHVKVLHQLCFQYVNAHITFFKTGMAAVKSYLTEGKIIHLYGTQH